ncbi:MAG: hypothetical protein D6B27_00060 [Gammaproteobacteria bacterium]|nr:MAG: hypothetical protein D6B27_00060 [Gammaproteobacteria bacterium]
MKEEYDSDADVIAILSQATEDELLCIARSLDISSDITAEENHEEIFNYIKHSCSGVLDKITGKIENIHYSDIVLGTAKILHTHSSSKSSEWAAKNYRILEEQIFETVFQTYLASLSGKERCRIEDELETLSRQLGEKYSKVGSGIFAIAAASLGGSSLVATITSSISMIFAPITWLAIGAMAAYKFRAANYRKIIPCLTILSSVRQRIEHEKAIDNGDYATNFLGGIKVKNGF